MRGKISPGPGLPERDAELIDVEQAIEPWSEYHLADGSVLRVKQVAMQVWRIEGAYDQEGNPQYVIKTAGVMSVRAPENLKKRLN